MQRVSVSVAPPVNRAVQGHSDNHAEVDDGPEVPRLLREGRDIAPIRIVCDELVISAQALAVNH